MKNKKLIQLLNKSKDYASLVGEEAEALHDDMGGEYYMDIFQYEIILEVNNFIAEIQLEINKLEAL